MLLSNNMKEFSDSLLSLPRNSKRAIAIIIDIGLCLICTWLAFNLSLEALISFKDYNFDPALISIIIAIPIFWLFGLYRTIFRYTSLSIIITILASSFVYGLLYFLVVGVYSIERVPRSIGILQPMLLFFAILCSRLSFKFILNHSFGLNKVNSKNNVLVYGAGDAGRQLIIALENSPTFKVVGFLDDNKKLHGQVLLGQNIYSLRELKKLVINKNINLVFLAMPSIGRNKRNQIIENLKEYKLKVKTLPSISEIVDGRITITDIKDLNVEDLLNRKEVKPDYNLLNKNIYSKTILVTGGGGSIGSELCRQIIRLSPSKLILAELNEFALYKIYEELIVINKNLKIIPLLLNVQNQKKLEIILETFEVDTVYHAAAYKHVSLVEENICEGVKNNVFSTLAIAKASIAKKVANLVLVSSDKAVRPTNIMGASKRIAELCMQGIYNENKSNSTNFAIVRFGNVLESSGSVIPKFRKQIKEGGPVTITHPKVTRYFMTISEAAQLVIQAGAMGKNCEVFILDMGKSIKILDLIHRMIKLSGFSVKNNKNLDGDIEVKTIGLKPGEKLQEELLIGDNPQRTHHKKIRKAQDPFIPFDELMAELNNLSPLLDNNKVIEVKDKIKKLIPSYQSNTKIVDQIYKGGLYYRNEMKMSSGLIEQENKIVSINNK